MNNEELLKQERYYIRFNIIDMFMSHGKYNNLLSDLNKNLAFFQQTKQIKTLFKSIFETYETYKKNKDKNYNENIYNIIYELNQIINVKKDVTPFAILITTKEFSIILDDLKNKLKSSTPDIDDIEAKKIKIVLSEWFSRIYLKVVRLEKSDTYKDRKAKLLKTERKGLNFSNYIPDKLTKLISRIENYETVEAGKKNNAQTIIELIDLIQEDCDYIFKLLNEKYESNITPKIEAVSLLENMCLNFNNTTVIFTENPHIYSDVWWDQFKIDQFFENMLRMTMKETVTQNYDQLIKYNLRWVLNTLKGTYEYNISKWEEEIKKYEDRWYDPTANTVLYNQRKEMLEQVKEASSKLDKFITELDNKKDEKSFNKYLTDLENFINDNCIGSPLFNPKTVSRVLTGWFTEGTKFGRLLINNKESENVYRQFGVLTQHTQKLRENLINNMDESNKKLFERVEKLQVIVDIYQQDRYDADDYFNKLKLTIIITILVVSFAMMVNNFFASTTLTKSTGQVVESGVETLEGSTHVKIEDQMEFDFSLEDDDVPLIKTVNMNHIDPHQVLNVPQDVPLPKPPSGLSLTKTAEAFPNTIRTAIAGGVTLMGVGMSEKVSEGEHSVFNTIKTGTKKLINNLSKKGNRHYADADTEISDEEDNLTPDNESTKSFEERKAEIEALNRKVEEKVQEENQERMEKRVQNNIEKINKLKKDDKKNNEIFGQLKYKDDNGSLLPEAEYILDFYYNRGNLTSASINNSASYIGEAQWIENPENIISGLSGWENWTNNTLIGLINNFIKNHKLKINQNNHFDDNNVAWVHILGYIRLCQKLCKAIRETVISNQQTLNRGLDLRAEYVQLDPDTIRLSNLPSETNRNLMSVLVNSLRELHYTSDDADNIIHRIKQKNKEEEDEDIANEMRENY